MLAEKRYHWILSGAKKDSGMESEEELKSEEISKVESIINLEAEDKNSSQVSDLKNPDVSHVKRTDVSDVKRTNVSDVKNTDVSDVKKIDVSDVKNTDVSDVKNTDVSSPASEMQVQAEANNAVDCCTDDGSVSTSEESELMIDATSPPDDVTKQADQLLKDMFLKGQDAENADNNEKESIVTVDLWDFAGQHLYYASHPVFLSSRAIYVLVHNLSKPLNAPAQPCVRQGTHDIRLENPNNETNLENLLSWLVTVHSMKPTGEGMVDKSERMLPYLRPPVFIVGTHADKPFEDAKTMTSTIQQGISGKEYEKHVIRPFFSIDNTRRNASMLHKFKKLFDMNPRRRYQAGQGDDTSGHGIDALRTKIMEVLRQEPYMGETIPVRWFNFEKVVEALVAKNTYHMSLEQLQTYAKEVCFVEDEDQFHTMLNFYHDLGMIIKHRNTVILKAQWLIDLFKMLITIPRFDEVDPIHSKYWQEVETSGVLSMELVDLVFFRFIQQGVIKEDILDMMEQFGLIAKFSPSPTDVKYFVPAQLKSSPEDLCKMEPSPTDPCPLYLHFVVDGFVPHGLFSRLVSRSTSWCSEKGSTQPQTCTKMGLGLLSGGK
ncbi:hypothetical protein OS493_038479 [Desmophyllum pertusum]|uniref:Uncharacterized protein n=1 Tax=Desmophyllum pertusum TaxID=174260 RepID=A0A9X0CDH4_9CNID|nr:hypothetical protein OS493_038479 [Desmophyllum pertusum]